MANGSAPPTGACADSAPPAFGEPSLALSWTDCCAHCATPAVGGPWLADARCSWCMESPSFEPWSQASCLAYWRAAQWRIPQAAIRQQERARYTDASKTSWPFQRPPQAPIPAMVGTHSVVGPAMSGTGPDHIDECRDDLVCRTALDEPGKNLLKRVLPTAQIRSRRSATRPRGIASQWISPIFETRSRHLCCHAGTSADHRGLPQSIRTAHAHRVHRHSWPAPPYRLSTASWKCLPWRVSTDGSSVIVAARSLIDRRSIGDPRPGPTADGQIE